MPTTRRSRRNGGVAIELSDIKYDSDCMTLHLPRDLCCDICVKKFERNDKKQPLFVVSSSVRNGSLETVAFSSRDLDFWDGEDEEGGEENNKGTVVAKKQRLIGRVVVMTWRGVRLVFLVRKMKQGVWHPPPPTSTSNATTTTAESSNIRREQTISTTKEFEKDGFFACLASSMLVPGAAGPPIPLLRSIHRNHHSPSSPSEEEEKEEEINEENISTCFDAFCYKPIPYRSAVANGATHVLALHSRPDGCEIPTKPTLYEKIVAPVYFRLNGLPLVGEYFENGGQQYRYLEDVLTLEDGLVQGCMFGPHATITTDMEDRSRREDGSVPVPPTEILFGTPDCITKRADPRTWKRVHLLPIVLPYGSDDGVGVGEDGNVNGGGGLNGDVGNGGSSMQSALERPVRVKGDIIEDYYQNEEYSSQSNQEEKRFKFVSWIRRKRLRRRRDKAREAAGKDLIHTAAVDFEKASSELELYVEDQDIDWLEAEALLAALPGFQ